MSKKKLSKLLALYLPYILMGLVATNFGEAWRPGARNWAIKSYR